MRIISGTLKGRRFSPPRQPGVRPTTDFARESLFNLLENKLDLKGVEALDLFCGTGAVSLELASRGAAHIVSVDKNGKLLGFLRTQAVKLELPIRTVRADAFRWIKKPREQFGLIFADPPYGIKHHEDIPNFVMATNLLKPGGWLVVEHPSNIDFSKNPQFDSHRASGAVEFSFFTR